MVTAEVEEVQVQETQPDSVPDTPVTPEAESAPPSDADALKAFEAEIGLEPETQAGEQAKEPTGQNPPASTTNDPEVERRVQERIEQDNRLRQENGVRQAYVTRTNNIRNVLTEVAMGTRPVDLNLVNWVVNQFTSHNADAQRFAGDGLAARWTDALLASAKEHVGSMGDRYDDTKTLVGDLVTKARDGYVSKREHDQAVKAAGVTFWNDLKKPEKLPILRALVSQIEGSSGGGGGAAAYDPRSDDAKLGDPSTPVAELMRIRERQRKAEGY